VREGITASIHQSSKGPVNQLVHRSVSITSTNQGSSKSTKRQPSIKSHDISWIVSSWTGKNEEVELVHWIYWFSQTLSLPNPTKLYTLIPTKQTLTPGLDPYPNPSLSPNPSPSSFIFFEIQSMKCQFRKTLDKGHNFAFSGNFVISDLPYTYGESNHWCVVHLIQYANCSDQRQTHPNNLIQIFTHYLIR